jgi:hypothetical protein
VHEQKKEEQKARFGKSGFRFLTEWNRLSCCGFGFSDFSDDTELLHQA